MEREQESKWDKSAKEVPFQGIHQIYLYNPPHSIFAHADEYVAFDYCNQWSEQGGEKDE